MVQQLSDGHGRGISPSTQGTGGAQPTLPGHGGATVAALLRNLSEEYKMRGRKSLREAEYHWKPLYGALGTIKAETLTAEALRIYVRARQQLGRSNATINRELAGLRTALKMGGIQWPVFPRLPEIGIRQGTYTLEEVERLAAALTPHVVPVLWFAYYTGRRRGEILQIKWGDVDWTNGWITIRSSTTKTGQPDRIPLVGELRSLIEALPGIARPPGQYLFLYHGKPFATFSSSWKTALRLTHLKDKLFHDFRRTAVTDMEEAGIPRGTAMAITGHKTFAVYQRYNIVRQSSIREGLSALQDHRRKT